MQPTIHGIFLLLVVCFFSNAEATPESGTIERYAPRPLPKTYFLDGQGKERTLEDFAEHPLLINFWATWCPPCVEEMPALSQLQSDWAHTGLQVIAVSQDFKGASTVERFYTKTGISNLPIYTDPRNRLYNSFKARALPVSVFVSAQGQEVGRVAGAINWNAPDVRKNIETLLNLAPNEP